MDTVIQFRGTIYENGYGLIAQKVMRDTNISAMSKAIYAYMCSFASKGEDGKTSAFPSVSLIKTELGIKSQDTFYKYRKELVNAGYITIEKQKRENGKFDRNIYYIEAVTPPCSKKSTMDEPCSKLSTTVKSTTKNWNTNITSFNITSINKEEEEDNNAQAREAVNSLNLKIESKTLTQNEKEFIKQCKRHKYLDEHVALLFNLVKDAINQVDFEAIRRTINIFEINMIKKNIKKPFNSDWLKTTLQNESMYIQYDKNKELALNSF